MELVFENGTEDKWSDCDEQAGDHDDQARKGHHRLAFPDQLFRLLSALQSHLFGEGQERFAERDAQFVRVLDRKDDFVHIVIAQPGL